MTRIFDLQLKADRSGAQFFGALLLLALFYSAYRYPFQISSAGTSPGYSDTPLVLQVGKYALFLAFAFWRTTLLVRMGLKRLSITYDGALLCICAFYLALHPVIALLTDPDPSKLINGLFWLAMPLLLVAPADVDGAPRPIRIEFLGRVLSFFLYANFCFLVLEIILFLFFQRLPALSYDDSILVRFGGIWDDPNGHCIFLSFFMPLAAYSQGSYKKKIFDLVALIFMMLATQSVTGIIASISAFFLSTTLLLFVDRNRAIYRRTLILPLILMFGLLVIVFFVEPLRQIFKDGFSTYIELKSGSVDGHAKSLESLESAGWLELAGLESAGTWGESGYANWVVNFGLIYLMAFGLVALVVLARTIRLIKRHRNSDHRIFLCSILCFQLTYFVGMVNLPLDTVFPTNLLFVLLSAISFHNLVSPSANLAVAAR